MFDAFSRCRFGLAALALAFHALSPVLSHAVIAASGKSLVEICTAEGFKTIEVNESGKSTPSLKHYPHCSDCLSLADMPADIPRGGIDVPCPAAHGSVSLSAGVSAFASAIREFAPSRSPPRS